MYLRACFLGCKELFTTSGDVSKPTLSLGNIHEDQLFWLPNGYQGFNPWVSGLISKSLHLLEDAWMGIWKPWDGTGLSVPST